MVKRSQREHKEIRSPTYVPNEQSRMSFRTLYETPHDQSSCHVANVLRIGKENRQKLNCFAHSDKFMRNLRSVVVEVEVFRFFFRTFQAFLESSYPNLLFIQPRTTSKFRFFMLCSWVTINDYTMATQLHNLVLDHLHSIQIYSMVRIGE